MGGREGEKKELSPYILPPIGWFWVGPFTLKADLEWDLSPGSPESVTWFYFLQLYSSAHSTCFAWGSRLLFWQSQLSLLTFPHQIPAPRIPLPFSPWLSAWAGGGTRLLLGPDLQATPGIKRNPFSKYQPCQKGLNCHAQYPGVEKGNISYEGAHLLSMGSLTGFRTKVFPSLQ